MLVKLYVDLVIGGARTTDPKRSKDESITMVPAHLIPDVVAELELRGLTIR